MKSVPLQGTAAGSAAPSHPPEQGQPSLGSSSTADSEAEPPPERILEEESEHGMPAARRRPSRSMEREKKHLRREDGSVVPAKATLAPRTPLKDEEPLVVSTCQRWRTDPFSRTVREKRCQRSRGARLFPA